MISSEERAAFFDEVFREVARIERRRVAWFKARFRDYERHSGMRQWIREGIGRQHWKEWQRYMYGQLMSNRGYFIVSVLYFRAAVVLELAMRGQKLPRDAVPPKPGSDLVRWAADDARRHVTRVMEDILTSWYDYLLVPREVRLEQHRYELEEAESAIRISHYHTLHRWLECEQRGVRIRHLMF